MYLPECMREAHQSTDRKNCSSGEAKMGMVYLD